jgi:hypothetical protein
VRVVAASVLGMGLAYGLLVGLLTDDAGIEV